VSAKVCRVILLCGFFRGCSFASQGAPSDNGVDLSQRTDGVGLCASTVSRAAGQRPDRSVETYVMVSGAKDTRLRCDRRLRAESACSRAAGGPCPMIAFAWSRRGGRQQRKIATHMASHGCRGGPEHRTAPAVHAPDFKPRRRHRRPSLSVSMRYSPSNDGDTEFRTSSIDRVAWGALVRRLDAAERLERDPRLAPGFALNPGTFNHLSQSSRRWRKTGLCSRPASPIPRVLASVTRFFEDIPFTAPAHYLLAVRRRPGHEFFEGARGHVRDGRLPRPDASMISFNRDGRVGTAFRWRYVAGRLSARRCLACTTQRSFVLLTGASPLRPCRHPGSSRTSRQPGVARDALLPDDRTGRHAAICARAPGRS